MSRPECARVSASASGFSLRPCVNGFTCNHMHTCQALLLVNYLQLMTTRNCCFTSDTISTFDAKFLSNLQKKQNPFHQALALAQASCKPLPSKPVLGMSLSINCTAHDADDTKPSPLLHPVLYAVAVTCYCTTTRHVMHPYSDGASVTFTIASMVLSCYSTTIRHVMHPYSDAK